ncbi:MAG: hypothetical protein GSR84_00415 [Desulfurococcales archaeon]|nr:hypothetical protein [Desulfurococcales archaeon]
MMSPRRGPAENLDPEDMAYEEAAKGVLVEAGASEGNVRREAEKLWG